MRPGSRSKLRSKPIMASLGQLGEVVPPKRRRLDFLPLRPCGWVRLKSDDRFLVLAARVLGEGAQVALEPFEGYSASMAAWGLSAPSVFFSQHYFIQARS